MSPSALVDVWVAGAGPAGLALATMLSERGASVQVVAPDPQAPWLPGYGTWEADLDGLPNALRTPVQEAVAARYERMGLYTDAEPDRTLQAPYLRFDTERLQSGLLGAARRAGVSVIPGRVLGLGECRDGVQHVSLDSGPARARVVVDASGRGLPGLDWQPTGGPGPGFQVAWGERVRVDTHPWAAGEGVLMDWRRLRDVGPEHGDLVGLPTFLYVMPLGPHEVFVEETSLVARPGLSLEVCRARLDARLAQLGVVKREVLEVERCIIPMGGGPVRPDGWGRPVLPFGAAAGLVHPASGYSLLASLRLAPTVAQALVEGLTTSGGRAAVAGAWGALWPLEARRTRLLHEYGLEVLLGMGHHELMGFWDTFFSGPAEDWQTFMSPGALPDDVALVMWRMFQRADPALRVQLAQGGVAGRWGALIRAVVGVGA